MSRLERKERVVRHAVQHGRRTKALTLMLVGAVVVAACEGPMGPAGPAGNIGERGLPGDTGVDGTNGNDGDVGQPGRSPYLTSAGLKLLINNVAVDAKGVATVTFTITDEDGAPLDMDGVYTEGAVAPRFVLAWLDETADKKPLQYTSYTTKAQTSPITGGSAEQPVADEGGVFALVDEKTATYTYTFAAPIAVADQAKTHTLGAWATRDFDGARYVANALFDFLPAGGDPSVKRDIVTTAACNACHNPLAVHGGARREVGLCVLCHTGQVSDPDTGNTVDFRVMVHKIHRGKALPSVVAGAPYQIIGYQQAVHDYSTVGFPQEIQRCEACHTGSQADVWKNAPSRLVCGSCHDSVSFDASPPPGMTPHAGGPQADESKCNVCHPPAGGLAGVETTHLTPTTDPAAPKIKFTIKSVTKTGPGQTPEVVFDVEQDGAALDIMASPLARLSVTVAGPTTDIASYTSYTIQGSGASGTLAADPGGFRYIFPSSMAAAATGSYAFGLEGYVQPGGAAGPRYSAHNEIAYAAVTDAAPVPRRAVVDVKQCNSCHYQLGAHGGQRNDPQYCVFCHNPNNVNDERVSRFEGTDTSAKSVNLAGMVHKIHMGEELSEKPSILGGFPAPSKANPAGTPIDFSEVRFPGDRKACGACHAGATYTLPLAKGLSPVKAEQILQCVEDPAADGDAYCDTRVVAKEILMQPTAAACTGCHDAPYVVAHAETMTSASGVEACATCHGAGAEFDVLRVHALAP